MSALTLLAALASFFELAGSYGVSQAGGGGAMSFEYWMPKSNARGSEAEGVYQRSGGRANQFAHAGWLRQRATIQGDREFIGGQNSVVGYVAQVCSDGGENPGGQGGDGRMPVAGCAGVFHIGSG